MATCVVTGGAASSGSHLCDALMARGNRVHLRRQLRDRLAANIAHLRMPEFVFMHADVTEPFFVEEPVDFVFHFASPASPIDYLRLPLHTLKVGSYGTHHALGPGEAAPRALPRRPRRARSTATRRCIRSPSPTGAT